MDKSELFSSLEQRYGLPEGYLARTEILESGGGKKTFNPDSGAAGNFQFLPRYQKAYGITDPYNLQQSAEAAAKLAANNRVALQQKGIENPSAADLYAAHQQGASGYAGLLKAGDKPAASVVGKDAVLLNGGKPNMTASDFANKITSKFSGEGSSQPKPIDQSATGQQTATGVFAKPNVDVAENPDQAAALEGQAALSTQDVLDTSNAAAGRSGSGLKELGFLHNYFKSLDTSATGVKPLTVPNFFNQPKYKHGGIVSLKEDAKRVRAAGIGGDTVLAHITPSEADLLKSMGGSGRINPRTGLPMFDEGEGRGDPEGGGNSSNTGGSPAGDASGGFGGGVGEASGSGNQGAGSGNTGGSPAGDASGGFGGGIGGGNSLSEALGDTSLGSFGFSGITSDVVGPGISTPFSGQQTAPEAVPGYEGPGGKSVTESVFSGSTPTVEAAAPPSVLDTLNDVPSSFKSTPDKALGFDVTNALSLANVREAVERNINALVEAPATVGKSPSQEQAIQDAKDRATTIDRTVSFTEEGDKAKQEAITRQAEEQMNFSEIGKQVANSALTAFSALTSNPTTTAKEAEAASSLAAQTAKDQAVANALSSLVEAPAVIGTTPSTSVAPSTSVPSAPESGKVANAPESTVSNLVGGFLSGINSSVNSVTNAVSSMLGKGNTTDSPANNTTDSRSSTDVGPGPSTGDRGDYGGTDGGRDSTDNTVVVPTTTLTTPITPAESSIKYDISKFLGDVGKTTYTTPASVYTSYPVQQGIGSIAAPKYTGSFYNPSFGKIPYQRRYP